ncbi:MAG: PBP1A family penicillin-binding protein [Candidatus Marinimicrobia bacterium]|nr:PBP1A family penicillin-binding protein [Candidatus Neomarinimicrobiota bacterium]
MFKKEIKKESLFVKRLKIALWISLGFAGLVLAFLFYLSRDLPSLEELERFDPDVVTRIMSKDGEVIQELFTTKRVLVKFNDIPQHVKDALVSTEDQRFYTHWGMNPFRTIFQLANNVITGRTYGASTLTQQLARNLYNQIGFRKTYTRKLRELITAIQIERTYTKQEILSMYLNTVYFGHGLYGIQSAAHRYFGKDAKDLTIDEGAILVGILRSPAVYSPLNYPDRAERVRNVVIQNMYREGFLGPVERNYYRAKPILTAETEVSGQRELAPYFGEYVRQTMEQWDEKLGVDLYRDGLTIKTSLDARLQRIANRVVRQQLERLQTNVTQRLLSSDTTELHKLLTGTGFSADSVRLMLMDSIPVAPRLRDKLMVQAQLVALDVETGHIRAMVGGRNFKESKWNRSTQARRQPGSSFKLFLYTTAIDNGYPVTTELLNQPVVIHMNDSVDWRPKNYDESTGGLTTLREALRRSLNLVSVRLIQELVKPSAVVEYAHRMGISTPLRAFDALALGTEAVIPIEMAAAYAAYPRLGVWKEPIGVLTVLDRYGSVIKTFPQEQKEVLGRGTAYIMTSMLQTVGERGTGQTARTIYRFNVPYAGKTGTTQSFTDAWFVGFTTKLSVAVWVGMDDPQVSLGNRQSGAVAALPIWVRFMKATYDSLGWVGEEFSVPQGDVVYSNICSETHDLATTYCPTEREVFLPGTEPKKYCNQHASTAPVRDVEF